MSDREHVKWLRALLIIWGSTFFPMLMMSLGAPAEVNDGPAAIGGLLVYVGIATVVYLLILSWRAAYVSGAKNR